MTTTSNTCTACQNLEDYAFDFVANGLSDDMKSSLRTDNGLLPSTGHDDCKDLNDLNDCLVGGMVDKIPSYDECDIDQALQDVLENLYNVLGAIIANDCGQWDNIHALWDEINKIKARLDAIEKRLGALEKATADLGDMREALRKILQNLYNSGAWSNTGDTIFKGSFNSGRNIANGNINLFGGTADGSSFIRTNNGKTENDLFGGK